MEAIIGAVAEDCEWDMETIESVVEVAESRNEARSNFQDGRESGCSVRILQSAWTLEGRGIRKPGESPWL